MVQQEVGGPNGLLQQRGIERAPCLAALTRGLDPYHGQRGFQTPHDGENAAPLIRRPAGKCLRREIAAAYARYNRAFRAMQIYRVGVRDRAVANLEVVRQTYELGSKSLLDYIGEHHRYIDAENGFIDAQLETYVAMVEVLKVTNDPQLR